MAVPARVYELIERFDRNREAYLSSYNETQVRGDFIDPLLEELGWDVHNREGHPEAYRQVIEEDKIKIGGGTKAPDYGFYVGGARKFYLEAKQPSVDIAGDLAPAVQLRRYAWTAQLPLSIVSDFEEFAFYDCRFEPQKTDKASTARLDHITYDKYADRWDQIYSVFSYEAVRDGSLDKFAETTKRKRGTQTVDDAFLKEIEGWREALARDLALSNTLNRRQLNYAVQMIIDRIVFLRMAEDRGIEDYGRLLGVTDTAHVYDQLCSLFREADDRYNSGLFHFRREKGRSEDLDGFTLGLKIDDALLRRIIGGLYYPESPYEFGVLPEDVLGQVYERFLGKVIRLENGGHRAVVEEKPEVRKAGGVYYTPIYIVDYIVENTVGKLLEKKTPEQALKLKIVDPACGSGSFLLGAYKYLLGWYCDRYLKSGAKKHLKKLYQGVGGRWMLTIDEKKRILLNNIYGVDIDPQAVEVTKLSLLLKVLEGESEQTLETQLRMFHERALPDLDNNIKNGNSLIGPGFYEDEQAMLLDEEEHYRVNIFDWKAEFPSVFTGETRGFDAVIGNPPYVNVENIPKSDRTYLVSVYGENGKLGKRYDIYQVFVLKGISLLKNGGLLGFILPNTFLMGHSYAVMRKRVCEQTAIKECVDLPQGVFRGVTVDNVLLFLQGEKDSKTRGANEIVINKLKPKSDKSRVASRDWDESFRISQCTLTAADNFKLNILTNSEQKKIFRKMESVSLRLGDITDSSQGIILYKTSQDAQRAEHTGTEQKAGWKRLLRGKNIGRYQTKWGGEFVHYGPWLWCPRDERFFEEPKLLLHAMRNKSLARRLVATYDADKYYNAHNLANIVAQESSLYNLKYVLGLFNSRLLNFWYKSHFPNVNINPNNFRQLPIRALNFSDPEDMARHDRIVRLAERMLALHEKLAAAKIGQERTIIQRQIEATDRQIDQLVYELYELTEEEIKVVEGG